MSLRREVVDASRPGLIVGLLLSSLLLTGVLAWQAQASLREQRAAAEKVLRDYAMLAADEYARRTVAELGFYGFYPLANALRRTPAEGPPSPARLASDTDGGVRSASDLAAAVFHSVPGDHRLRWSGRDPGPEVQAWVQSRLATSSKPKGSPYVAIHGAAEGTALSLVYLASGPELNAPLIGFLVDQEALAKRFAKALAGEPLFPKSLLHGALGNDALFLRLTDPAGHAVFRWGERREPFLSVLRPFATDYNGILDGFAITAAVDPAAAPSLVIGGLPRSRLPLLIALLTLTTGLSLIAILQLRREQALARLRSNFVSRVSHELRTPLTQIRMFSETLLLDRVRSPAERQRCLEIIDRESRRLTNLVENVLRFSRAERGVDHVEARACDIVPLVRQFVADFAPLAGPGTRIETILPEKAIAEVDDSALRQVLLNLLDNAVKYGPPGQHIRLELSTLPQGVRLVVEDQGPGVPAAERELVWRRFYRLRRHQESAIAGTGIGLAVVRELVELLGGSVAVEDASPQGARFIVLFRQGRGEEAHA